MFVPYESISAVHLQTWTGVAIIFLALSGGLACWLAPVAARRRVESFLRGDAGRWPTLGRRSRQPKSQSPWRVEPAPTAKGSANPEPASVAPEPAAELEAEALRQAAEASAYSRRCKMDLAATRSGLELTVELPGVEEKDIAIQLADDLLTISGHISFEPDREEKNYRMTERDFGCFSRSIELPEGVAPEKIRAVLNRGLLTVTIPNPAKLAPRTIPVQGEPMSLTETDDGYELIVEMPGHSERDVEVLVSNAGLAVRSKTDLRTVELPREIDVDQIGAVLSNGVLRVTMPRPVHPSLRKVDIRVAA